MGDTPPRSEDTIRLIAELRRRRRRRRRLTILLIVVFTLCGGAAIAAGVLLPSRNPSADGTAAATSGAAAFTSPTSAGAPSPAGPPDSASAPTVASTPTPSSTPSTSAPSTTAVKRPTSTSAAPATATTSAATEVASAASHAGSSGGGPDVVVIDPGHQGPADLSYEPIGPGSSTNKYKMSKGTSGVVTGLPESEVDLAISLKLREELEARGITVVMTRTSEDVNISNIERAKIANEAGARLFIRIHCDAIDNSSARGIHVLYPAYIEGWTDDIYEASRRAAELAQAALVAATGAQDRGLDERDDMTGFNWSDVPVIMPELGFMTNPEEDRLLASPSYQQKIAVALAEAALRFLEGR